MSSELRRWLARSGDCGARQEIESSLVKADRCVLALLDGALLDWPGPLRAIVASYLLLEALDVQVAAQAGRWRHNRPTARHRRALGMRLNDDIRVTGELLAMSFASDSLTSFECLHCPAWQTVGIRVRVTGSRRGMQSTRWALIATLLAPAADIDWTRSASKTWSIGGSAAKAMAPNGQQMTARCTWVKKERAADSYIHPISLVHVYLDCQPSPLEIQPV
jgi:hypothetical protein